MEYALLIALIAAVIVGAVLTLGATTAGLFDEPCEQRAAAGNPC